MLETILFILIIGLLIFIHELGHFLTAKRAGVKVEEFGFGFPPRIFGIKKGETIYSLNLIPLGGFVKIFGESGEGEGLPESFISKTVWQKTKIIIAGSLMNWLLAAVIFSIVAVIGIPEAIDKETSGKILSRQITIIGAGADSPASQAGFKVGDALLTLKFKNASGVWETAEIFKIDQFQDLIAKNKGQEVVLTIKRGQEIIEKTASPRLEPPPGQGPLGVALADTGLVSYPLYLAPFKGLETAFNLTWLFIGAFANLLKDLVVAGKVTADLAGPVGIAALTFQFYQLGLNYLLQFIAILSLNLAIINMIPFPALDGGRFLFLIIEKFRGAPINQKAEKIIHAVGFALLIILVIVVTVRDIDKLF